MAYPTSITCTVDNTEYSRYEKNLNTITVTVSIQGGAPYTNEPILVELTKARRSRDAVVASETIQFSGSSDPQEAVVEFYLPDIVDQDLISLIRAGKYFVKASHVAADISAESDDFDIRIVSVERLKKDWLFGLDLASTDIVEPKYQPSDITGVTVTKVSKGHKTGFGTLTYNTHENHTANATASIGAGVNGVVTVTGAGSLQGSAANGYTIATVIPAGTAGLSVSVVGTAITVNLAVIAGVPDNAQNTATLIAAAINALADFNATASGTGVTPISTVLSATFSGGTTVTLRTLSWKGGALKSITGAGTYILPAGSSGPVSKLIGTSQTTEYITVRVSSPSLLPDENTAEDLLIEHKQMDDETLGRYLNEAIAYVENDLLQIYIEPTNVVTDRDPTTIQYAAGVNAPTPIFTDTDFDYLVSPLTHFGGPRGAGWLNIQFPYPQLLRIDSLYGSVANTRVIDIDLEWIEISQQGGLVQILPFNQEIAFDFVGLVFANSVSGYVEIPNFWHFNAIAGLRDCPADLQELVGKIAAINALTTAALAYRPGVGSLSLSRDGVSESVTYNSSATYGMFTGAITSYKEWMEAVEPKLRAKYRGSIVTIV